MRHANGRWREREREREVVKEKLDAGTGRDRADTQAVSRDESARREGKGTSACLACISRLMLMLMLLLQ